MRLAREIDLPLSAVTQTFSFIARKGAGKTYAGGKLVELLYAATAQCIVLDVVGNWYGLRLAADGKSPGIRIPVFGGDHGDVPFNVEDGPRLARLLVERKLSAVIDVSLLRKNERATFVAEFAEELFFAKKQNRSPLMVVLEEAHKFAPQQAKGQERMLGAIEDLVRLGRNYGIGATLISQRPQSISKEVLNQVECLFVGQLNGKHERDAVRDWIKTQDADRSDEALDKLPTLVQGEMVCWSPQWLKFFGTVHIERKWTFDASSTPELGSDVKSVTLEAWDFDDLKAALTEEVGGDSKRGRGPAKRGPEPESAPSTKVRELERKISELELELQVAKNSQAVLTNEAIQRLEVAVERFHEAGLNAVNAARDAMARFPERANVVTKPDPVNQSTATVVQKSAPKSVGNGEPDPDVGNGGLRRILVVLAQADRAGNVLKKRVAVVRAGMTLRSGTTETYLSRARQRGWIDSSGDSVVITTRGISALGRYEPLPEGEALFEYWARQVGSGPERILRTLRKAHPKPVPRERLALSAGFQTLRSGTFETYVSRLRRLDLIEGRGELKLNQELVG